jgi:predicted Zn-dependent protease
MSEPQHKTVNRNAPTSNRELWMLAGIFAATLILVVWGVSALFDFFVDSIPPSFERQLGKLILPVYEQQAEKSPAKDTLEQLIDRLETNLTPKEKKDRNYNIIYIPDATVNAMAIPGDTIVIYRGLLESIESENELMMVLGHELGHFVHRDHLRRLGKLLILQTTISYFFGDLAGFATSTIEAIGNAHYSQTQEREADAFGLNLLDRTYGHVGGATDFFARLSRETRLDLGILSTHPDPAERVKLLKKLIEVKNYPIKSLTPLPKTLDFSS